MKFALNPINYLSCQFVFSVDVKKEIFAIALVVQYLYWQYIKTSKIINNLNVVTYLGFVRIAVSCDVRAAYRQPGDVCPCSL